MKAEDIFKAALALLGETPAANRGYEPMALPLLNQLLMQCLEAENTVRRSQGKPPLEEAPVLAALGEDVDYSPRLCRDILPPGLAAKLILEDDPLRSGFFENSFRERLTEAIPAYFAPMEDWYR